MTPKEKAKELYLKFYIPKYFFAKEGMSSDWRKQATKRYALLNVDEILDIIEDDGFTFAEYHDKKTIEYWFEVKQEIEKL